MAARGRIKTWEWRTPTTRHPWQWCRIYHPTPHVRTGTDHRAYGPLGRLDHHTVQPAAPADPHTLGLPRRPNHPVRRRQPPRRPHRGSTPAPVNAPRSAHRCGSPLSARPPPVPLLDIKSEGAAMLIDALPSLATGATTPALAPRNGPARSTKTGPARTATRPRHLLPVRARGGTALALMNTAGTVQLVRDRSSVGPELHPAQHLATCRDRGRRREHHRLQGPRLQRLHLTGRGVIPRNHPGLPVGQLAPGPRPTRGVSARPGCRTS